MLLRRHHLLLGGGSGEWKVEQVRFRLRDALKVRVVPMGVLLHQIVHLLLFRLLLRRSAKVMRLHHHQ